MEICAKASTARQAREPSPSPTNKSLVGILEWLGHHELPHSLGKSGPLSAKSTLDPWDADGGADEESRQPLDTRFMRAKVEKPSDTALESPRASCELDPPSTFSRGASCSSGQTLAGDAQDDWQEEAEEWELRAKLNGSVGRMVVYDGLDMHPKDDIWFRGGGLGPFVVAGVREGGQANKAGVMVGDRLVSMNGEKAFMGVPLDDFLQTLDSATVLVFLGFAGRMHAEVQLTSQQNDSVAWCGVPGRACLLQELSHGTTTSIQVCEERVFDVGIASLFLVVSRGIEEPFSDADAEESEWASSKAEPDYCPMLELHHSEAHKLVKAALTCIQVADELPREELKVVVTQRPGKCYSHLQPIRESHWRASRPDGKILGLSPLVRGPCPVRGPSPKTLANSDSPLPLSKMARAVETREPSSSSTEEAEASPDHESPLPNQSSDEDLEVGPRHGVLPSTPSTMPPWPAAAGPRPGVLPSTPSTQPSCLPASGPRPGVLPSTLFDEAFSTLSSYP
mmetsp:Transcript_62442/g.140783  ORF Transcript_62442/g.140783 Transcript_62442/m.140783 type:complete len:509 (-) Transcript_62442:34-1560(-)